MVAMRDGVRLATDVYRPAGARPVPAILVRTPYDKDAASPDGGFFAQHGYAYVVQDTRGRFNSEGTFQVYTEDSADGLDSARWLNRQPWFDQHAGFALYGESYVASTALSMAEMDPPNLKAAYLSFASANYHDDGAWRGGAFELAHNVMFTAVTLCPRQTRRGAGTPRAPLPTVGDSDALFALEAATPLDQPLLTDNCPWYADWTLNADENGYWDQPGLNHLARFAQLPAIPIALVSGWYDQFLDGTVLAYQNAPADAALTIGPWIHGQTNLPTAGDGYFGPSATLDRRTDALQWFDRYLKGSPSAPLVTGVRYFLMGGGSGQASAGQVDIGGSWQTAPSWPPPDVQFVPYYFHTDGGLSPDQPGSEAPDTYQYDPHDPVPTIGGNISSGSVFAPAGAYLQRCRRDWPACRGSTDDLTTRPDVLTYQTEPLDQDLTVVGPVSAEVYASTTAADTDFTAKLVDVDTNGDGVNVADGIIRGRYNDDRTKAHFVTPGTVHRYTIDLWHTAMVFRAGHRVRVDISSSNFPHYDRNLNTGGPLDSDLLDNALIASQVIFHDAQRASRIVLPTRANT
jgi:uncharacterized protein